MGGGQHDLGGGAEGAFLKLLASSPFTVPLPIFAVLGLFENFVELAVREKWVGFKISLCDCGCVSCYYVQFLKNVRLYGGGEDMEVTR